MTRKPLILLILIACRVTSIFSQQISGGEIYYSQIDSFKYAITAHLYRKCNFNSLNSVRGYVYANSLKLNLNLKRISIENISDTCGNPCNKENGFSNLGHEKHTFVDTIDFTKSPYNSVLQQNICTVNFGINENFREGPLTTMDNHWFYLDAMVNLCHNGKFLKSPEFNIKPKFTLPCNQPLIYNPGVVNFDTDDSLGFELSPVEYDKGKPISYTNNFNINIPATPYCPPNPGVINCRPIPNAKPSRGFFFDNNLCEIIYTPTKCDEVSVIKFKINQYRYNPLNKQYVLVGYVHREMVQSVYFSLNTENPYFSVNTYKYNSCSDQNICIKIKASNPNNDTVFLNWNQTIEGANVKLLDSNAIQKELEICTNTNSFGNRIRNSYFTVTASNKKCNSSVSKGFMISTLPSIKSKIKTEPIIGCNALSLNLEPDENDSNLYKQPLSYSYKIKHLPSQQIAFSSNKQKDTFRFLQNGTYVIESKILLKPYNCGKTNYDTVVLDGIFALDESHSDILVCKGDSVILGDPNFDLNKAKISWEFPIGNLALDSSNTFKYTQNGNRNKIRMRFQNKWCNSFQDITVYSDSNNFTINYNDTGICSGNLINLKLVNVFPKTINTLWIINNKDSFYRVDLGDLKINNDQQIKVQLINNPKCIEEKSIFISARSLPHFQFTDSISCQNKPSLIQVKITNYSVPIKSFNWSIDQNPIGNKDSILNYIFKNSNTKIDLKITDSLNCSFNESVYYKAFPPPKFAFVDSVVCQNLTPTISVIDTSISVLNYLWTVDGINLDNNKKTLTYDFYDKQQVSLKAIDTLGCSTEKSMTISMLNRPEFDLLTHPYCKEQNAQINLNYKSKTPIIKHEWFINGIKTTQTTNSLFGKFIDTTNITHYLTDSNNCIASRTIQIAPYQANVQITGLLDYNYHDYVKLSANDDFNSYLWNNNTTSKNNEFWAKSLGPPGQYAIKLTVKDSNACEATHTAVINTDKFTAITNKTMHSLQIYPNPSDGLFTVETDNNGVLEIYSTSGQLIMSQTIQSGKTMLNIKHLQNGVYALKWKDKVYKFSYRD
jgi:hypothetical protein